MSRPHGFSEDRGQVILRMTRSDYEQLRLMMNQAIAATVNDQVVASHVDVYNRVNEGNPNFIPLQVRKKI